jgi:hypothetical protein
LDVGGGQRQGCDIVCEYAVMVTFAGVAIDEEVACAHRWVVVKEKWGGCGYNHRELGDFSSPSRNCTLNTKTVVLKNEIPSCR